MFRRGFLQTAIAGSLAACAVAPPSRRVADQPTRWLDVHCHVFNAHDVPIYEFVRHTKLSGGSGAIAAPLLAIVAAGLQHDAPSPAAELATLDGRAFAAAALQVGPIDATPGLLRLRERAVIPARTGGPFAAASAPLRTRGAPTGTDALRLFDDAFREASIRTAPTPAKAPTPKEIANFNTQITHGTGDFASTIRRYYLWALGFSAGRDALVGRLANLYPGQELMLTPAMVDYDLWLGADSSQTDLGGQAAVMSAIAAKRGRAGLPVHAFLAFDPWRCLAERAQGRDPLADVATSIQTGGAVGIKLYPPMGFAAAGNAARAPEDFPPGLQRLTGGKPGPALDAMMDELFDRCAADGIPVMAHCGQSNGSRPEYETLAGPNFWQQALTRPRPHRRELRLNLGHFGGIWELGAKDTARRDWAGQIAGLFVQYPNVYADIGYFGSVLTPGEEATVAATGAYIAELAAMPRSSVRERLMYGSDWSMIGQEQTPEEYPHRALDALAATWPGERQEDLRWRNAARFLGLASGEPTRARLDAFYSAHAINPAPLRRFDPTAA